MSERQKSFWAQAAGWVGFGGLATLAVLIWSTSAGVTAVSGKVSNHETRIEKLEATGGAVLERHEAVDKELKREADERFQRIEAATAGLPEMRTDIKLILQRLDHKGDASLR